MVREPIYVYPDVEIKELVPGFLDNRMKELKQLNDAVLSADLSTLQAIGHRLKGSAGGYGFTGLGEFGKMLEMAAKEKDLKAAAKHVESINDYLQRVQVKFDKVS